MKNYLEMDSVPLDEPCVNAGNDIDMQKLEARTMIEQIERTYGPFPDDFEMRPNRNIHEAGIYYDVKLSYIEGHEESENFAFQLEGDWPIQWDETSKTKLHEAGYFQYLKTQERPNIHQFI